MDIITTVLVTIFIISLIMYMVIKSISNIIASTSNILTMELFTKRMDKLEKSDAQIRTVLHELSQRNIVTIDKDETIFFISDDMLEGIDLVSDDGVIEARGVKIMCVRKKGAI